MTTHRSGPKCKQQVLTFLSRLIWCCRKRNYRGRSLAGGGGGGTGKLRRSVGPAETVPAGAVSVWDRWGGRRAGKRRVGGSWGVAVPAVPLLPKREDFRSTPPRAASAPTPTSPFCPQLKGRNRNLDGLKHLPRIAWWPQPRQVRTGNSVENRSQTRWPEAHCRL